MRPPAPAPSPPPPPPCRRRPPSVPGRRPPLALSSLVAGALALSSLAASPSSTGVGATQVELPCTGGGGQDDGGRAREGGRAAAATVQGSGGGQDGAAAAGRGRAAAAGGRAKRRRRCRVEATAARPLRPPCRAAAAGPDAVAGLVVADCWICCCTGVAGWRKRRLVIIPRHASLEFNSDNPHGAIISVMHMAI